MKNFAARRKRDFLGRGTVLNVPQPNIKCSKVKKMDFFLCQNDFNVFRKSVIYFHLHILEITLNAKLLHLRNLDTFEMSLKRCAFLVI